MYFLLTFCEIMMKSNEIFICSICIFLFLYIILYRNFLLIFPGFFPSSSNIVILILLESLSASSCFWGICGSAPLVIFPLDYESFFLSHNYQLHSCHCICKITVRTKGNNIHPRKGACLIYTTGVFYTTQLAGVAAQPVQSVAEVFLDFVRALVRLSLPLDFTIFRAGFGLFLQQGLGSELLAQL